MVAKDLSVQNPAVAEGCLEFWCVSPSAEDLVPASWMDVAVFLVVLSAGSCFVPVVWVFNAPVASIHVLDDAVWEDANLRST